MDYTEFRQRVAMYLQMHGLSASAATACVHWRNDMILWAYKRAHAARDVAAALVKIGA